MKSAPNCKLLVLALTMTTLPQLVQTNESIVLDQKRVRDSIDESASFNDRNACGRPVIPPNVRPRIVSGVEAVKNSWPWTVSISRRGIQHYCAASIINNQWLVSAAHCFLDIDSSIMVIGSHYVDARRTMYQKYVRVAYTVAHERFGSLPEFTPGWYGVTHDIRLVKLAHPLTFNAGVQPVCLPRRNQTFPAGKYCYTSGWGNTKYGSSPAESMQQLRLPLRDTTECNQPRWYNGTLDDVQLCAGYTEGGRGACHGDSGNPLVCLDEDNRWVLVGVGSWGYECAAETRPMLYAKVSMFIDWIQEQIAQREAAEAGIVVPQI